MPTTPQHQEIQPNTNNKHLNTTSNANHQHHTGLIMQSNSKAANALNTSSDNSNNNNANANANNSPRSIGLYWEGPPAHFMLPTHAIHCRLSRSVERCPRACKGNDLKFQN